MSARSPVRLLFVSSRGDAGWGGETYLLQAMKYLDRERFEPLVLLPEEGTLRPILEGQGVRVEVVPANYGWNGPDPAWYKTLREIEPRVRRLVAFLRAEGIGLIHTNSNFHMDAALAGRICGVRHLYLAHIQMQEDTSLFQRLRLDPASHARLMGHISDGIVAVSRSVAERLSPPLPPEKVRVIHNGVETEAFDTALAHPVRPLHSEFPLPEDALIVLGVGRLTRDKGFDIFLEAARRIAARHPRAWFFIAGGPAEQPVEEDLARRVRDPAFGGRAHLLGFRDDIRDVLAEADVFVLSSRLEGHPYVLLEAMAARCAPIAALCQGVDETLDEGIDGLKIPTEDPAALVTALETLLTDQEQRERLAAAAHRKIRDRFHARHSIAGLQQVYEDILSAPPPLPGDPGVTLFLRAATEIGVLGGRVTAMEPKVRASEDFMRRLKALPPLSWARTLVRRFARRPA